MFKKRKQAKEAALQEFLTSLNEYMELQEDAFARMKNLKDPASKIVKLNALDIELGEKWSKESNDVYITATKKGNKLGNRLTGGAVVAGIAGMVVFPPAIIAILPATLAGEVGGAVIGDKFGAKEKKKMEEATADFFARMENLRDSIDKEIAATAEQNVTAISQSELSGKVLNIPTVIEAFSRAAARQLSEGKNVKVYSIEASGTVEARDALGRQIASLAAKNKEKIYFHDYADKDLGGAPVVLLECSDAFLESVRQLSACKGDEQARQPTERSAAVQAYFNEKPEIQRRKPSPDFSNITRKFN